MDFTPTILECVALPQGRVELVEWLWPDIIDFEKKEYDLMLEMALAPHATDASAEFPEIDPGNRCFVGTLFVRYPGITIHGRGEGGHIRVLRFIFDDALARRILGGVTLPAVTVLQGLLDIRRESLRKIMNLVVREMTAREDRSAEALAALQTLAAIEIRRLLDQQVHASPGGRLAAWQYRRIRERLAQTGPVPSAVELAALCGISVRHLNRQFLALTGSTVGDYVTNFWIERAKEMLAGDVPVKNIAFVLGFSHPNSFARAFRRATGVPPRRFRQRLSGTMPGENEA
ncbi:AraC-like DNA-binding protein [Sphingobium sp. OAS761]|uniref:helix-turn-helix domain-containing protein n=1 Tax=Sphingobium sp. OAS761 TaxID=2817901 RepID=UPI00209CA39A|nr:AraC family transcriptional regulator [Sphingobium sp. OAS761]MCP1470327.1 AraC-like DNA-binding protein [Sphingobium sp. OAS761]